MRMSLPNERICVVSVIDTLRRNGSDAINLFVVPLAISLLPWSLGFALLKRMARSDRGLSGVVEPAWQAARIHFHDIPEEEWKWRFRLLRLVERVDTWLILLRSTRWWRRQLTCTGEWPDARTGCILLTYHWGGGQWVWRVLREHGLHAHFLARRVQARDLGASRIALWCADVRGFGMRCAGGLGPLFTGGSSEAIGQALVDGRSIVGMLDLPAQPGQRVLRRPLLDGEVRFPYGLARLAESNAAPVALFSCVFDIETGRRELRIETLPQGSTAETIATRYMQHLDQRLRSDSAFWQLWSAAPAMFVPASQGVAGPRRR
jgi:hypothetical protein